MLSPAVNRGDLWRLNYNITPFSAEAPPRTPLGELMTLSQIPESDEEGILAQRSDLSARDPWAVLVLSWYPSLFRRKNYAPIWWGLAKNWGD